MYPASCIKAAGIGSSQPPPPSATLKKISGWMDMDGNHNERESGDILVFSCEDLFQNNEKKICSMKAEQKFDLGFCF